MGRGGGGGGRGGGGGAGIAFTGGGNTISGKTPDMRRPETLLLVPRRLSGNLRTSAQNFMDRTLTRLKRARNESQVTSILQRAEAHLSGLESAQVFPGATPPKSPW